MVNYCIYLEVVVGDVVVVGLHLAESLLVVLHEVVDVKVFSLFDLVNVHLAGGRRRRNRRHTRGRRVCRIIASQSSRPPFSVFLGQCNNAIQKQILKWILTDRANPKTTAPTPTINTKITTTTTITTTTNNKSVSEIARHTEKALVPF